MLRVADSDSRTKRLPPRCEDLKITNFSADSRTCKIKPTMRLTPLSIVAMEREQVRVRRLQNQADDARMN